MTTEEKLQAMKAINSELEKVEAIITKLSRVSMCVGAVRCLQWAGSARLAFRCLALVVRASNEAQCIKAMRRRNG